MERVRDTNVIYYIAAWWWLNPLPQHSSQADKYLTNTAMTDPDWLKLIMIEIWNTVILQVISSRVSVASLASLFEHNTPVRRSKLDDSKEHLVYRGVLERKADALGGGFQRGQVYRRGQ